MTADERKQVLAVAVDEIDAAMLAQARMITPFDVGVLVAYTKLLQEENAYLRGQLRAAGRPVLPRVTE